MKTRNIEHINHAVIVLRHFIELSSRLLPFLEELNEKHVLSAADEHDREIIIEAYRSYNFDTDTSEALMGSPILGIIRNNFEKMIKGKNVHNGMLEFKMELMRLRKNWKLIDSN